MSTFALQPLPLFQPITAKSEERISQVLEALKQPGKEELPTLFQRAKERGTSHLPTPQNDIRLMAYAFLVARNWNVRDAVKMANDACRFCEKYNFGQQAPFPSGMSIRGYDLAGVAAWTKLPMGSATTPLYRCMQTMSPLVHSGFHYWDRRGLPVAYWLAGRMDTHTVLKRVKPHIPVGSTIEDFFQIFGGGLVETGWSLCAYQDAVLAAHPQPGIDMGAPRRNFCTIIVDCKGMSYKMIDRQLLERTKAALQQMNCVFADFIHRIVAVNCPPMVRFAYSLLKSALNEGVQEKVTFVSPENTTAALDSVVGLERVPAFLGGRCNCPGGCIASYNPSAAFTAEEFGGEGDLITENITVGPGKKHEKVFELLQGEEVIWEFQTTKGTDVRFSVMFYPRQKGVSTHERNGKMRVRIDPASKRTTTENPVVKQEKLTDGADSYMAPEDGILQLVWDNSKSLVSDKGIQMRVYKSEAMVEGTE
ncbi:CRAL/TRIO domain containing protein [Novymonas esmeraldas]|uniref:CRAL/TRIO domain containing protein n=1 Tax=Novymonas esmeraldas TaxID=1808958 RepID=A0AAW0F291_9TRYP